MAEVSQQRKDLGVQTSKIGLVVNFALFVLKYTAGYLADSVSMKADAINNLSDFGSVLILLISFYMIARPADKEHPFGHARFEYLGSAFVAIIIVLIGFELGKASVEKIMNPQSIKTSWLLYCTLTISILTKLCLYFFYMKKAEKINSPLLYATAKDSISDVIATSGLLLAILFERYMQIEIDGYAGLLISVFIIYSGVSILLKTSNRLLGEQPDKKFKNSIKNYIKEQTGILGVHDLIIHDYGVDNYFATAHVEVDAAEDIKKSHELIDRIEREIALQFNVNMLLHMDPIDLNNPELNMIKEKLIAHLKSIDSLISAHDFRIIKTERNKKIIFDVKVPDSCPKSNYELRTDIQAYLKSLNSLYQSYITIDRNYAIDTVMIPDE